MNSLTNKEFSDWYDNQHGEPSYQQTFEAGQAHRPKEFDAEQLHLAECAIDKKLALMDQVKTFTVKLDDSTADAKRLRAELDVQICRVVELGGTDKMIDALLLAKVDASEQSAFEDWLAAKSPSGDVTRVKEQWEASAEFKDATKLWPRTRSA